MTNLLLGLYFLASPINLMASKTRVIPRTFNGFQKSAFVVELGRRVGRIWKACESPSRKNSTSHPFWLVQTWSKLSHLFPPVPTCSQLFTLVHNRSYLFTPVNTSVTIYALRAMAVARWIFPLQKLLFFDLTCYLVEIAYFCSPNRELSNSVWVE